MIYNNTRLKLVIVLISAGSKFQRLPENEFKDEALSRSVRTNSKRKANKSLALIPDVDNHAYTVCRHC